MTPVFSAKIQKASNRSAERAVIARPYGYGRLYFVATAGVNYYDQSSDFFFYRPGVATSRRNRHAGAYPGGCRSAASNPSDAGAGAGSGSESHIDFSQLGLGGEAHVR